MKKASNKSQYDLEERTAEFGENIIEFCKTLEQNVITKPIIDQIVRSSTSIGANYMEANAASSRRDFRNKIFICKKEAQGTKHWLRMMGKCVPEEKKDRLRQLWQECQQLVLIFQKITNSLSKK